MDKNNDVIESKKILKLFTVFSIVSSFQQVSRVTQPVVCPKVAGGCTPVLEMAIPFQKFPFLVIQAILQTMGFLDLFLLSCTSAKTKRIVKSVYKIRNHRLSLSVRSSLCFRIASKTNEEHREAIYLLSKEKQVDNVFHLKIGAIDNVPFNYEENEDHSLSLSTYWDTPKNGFNAIYDALFEVFGATIKEVNLDVNKVTAENYQNEMDWIENKFPNLPSLCVLGECSFQEYIPLIKSIKAKNFVWLYLKPFEHLENNEIINLEMEEISIRRGHWMSLEQIQAIKAQTIHIRETSLTDVEINMLLKNLNAFKERCNLKKLVIDFHREADPNIVLDGLDATDEGSMKPFTNQWSFKLANGEKCTIIYILYRNPDVAHFGFEFIIEN